MGTIASIILIPVFKGSFTLCRSITPDAFFSTGRYLFALISPLSSRGCPKAFTTLPIKASPTGTSKMRCVELTLSPSLILLDKPNKMAPT